MNHKIKKLLDNQGKNYILPFLWVHGEEESVLREYMKAIHEAHIGAVCVESRPHPDYVGPGWWRDMDVILDEARRRGMKVWILDDSHFPTGYANGALKAADNELCRQSLVYQIVECPNAGEIMELSLENYQRAADWKPNLNESYTIHPEEMRYFEDDTLISITAVKMSGTSTEDIIDLTAKAVNPIIDFQVPEGKWKIYVCHLTRNRGPHRNYINMMDPASCKHLLEAVYEPHYKHYTSDFGTTIAGFFSDEPELGNGHLYEMGKRIFELDDQAWSLNVEEKLREKWGGNFVKLLPLLWEQEFSDDLKAKVRYDYMDEVTKAVEQAFSMQIGNWCREHGVEYIGHLIEDNNQHTRTGSSLGHFFRGLSGQDMAGIDDIGGQVLPQGEWVGSYGLMGEERDGEFYHYVLGKLGASLAALDPLKKGRTMCEIFGAYGWEEGVRLEKYLVDHFLVRGINHFVPHAFSAKEFPDPDCPPHFYAHGHNPQYRHFGALMQYTNRICEIISDGVHIAPVAILYNAEAEWCGEYMELQEIAKRLADRQIDYDFIPADVFTNKKKYKTVLKNSLKINQQEYQVLIVPEAQYIPVEVVEAVWSLHKQGGRVLFINRYPDGICSGDNTLLTQIRACKVIKVDELVSELDQCQISEIKLNPVNERIRYLHYQGESDCYLFVNEGTEYYQGIIKMPEKEPCYAYNAWDNCLEKLSYTSSDRETMLSVVIEPGKSLIVIFDEAEGDIALREPVIAEGEEILWNNNWKRSICKSKEYPDFVKDTEVSLPDHLAEEYPDFSGFIRYEKNYVCNKVPERFLLEITDAYEGVEVFINNISAGIQIVKPFRFDVTSMLDIGINEICIEVATTLERELAKIPDPIRMYLGLLEKIPECPSGINGEIRIYVK